MAKDLSYAVSQELKAQEKQPILLVQLGLSSTTLYYAATKTSVTFNGNTYSPKHIRFGGYQQSSEGQINRVQLQLDNTTRDIATFVTSESFDGRPLVVIRAYRNAMSGTTDYVEVFRGSIEEVTNIRRPWVPISATTGKPLYQKALLEEYQRTCRHVFGDNMCNADGRANLDNVKNYAEGAVASGSSKHLIFTVPDSGVTGTNDDAFNYGIIKVGKSGTTYVRTCYDWTSATSRADWQVQLPVDIDNTYRAQIYKGCSKLLGACSMAYAYGPTESNQVNYGGFVHIALDPEAISAEIPPTPEVVAPPDQISYPDDYGTPEGDSGIGDPAGDIDSDFDSDFGGDDGGPGGDDW